MKRSSPPLNAGEVELLDVPKLQEQLLTLVTRGARIDHEPNGHDDWANAAAGVVCAIKDSRSRTIDDDIGFVSVDIGEHAGKIHSITVGWDRPKWGW